MESKIRAQNLPISTKQTVEICNVIRYMTVDQAKNILSRIMEKKQAVPYKRYNKDVPHKSGKIAASRYPISATTYVLKALQSAEANAQQQGASENLYLSHISAHKSGNQPHYGRKRSRNRKSTHLNIILEEKEQKNIKKEQQKKQKDPEIKQEKQDNKKTAK